MLFMIIALKFPVSLQILSTGGPLLAWPFPNVLTLLER